METKHANPRLASQAPNVRIIKAKNICMGLINLVERIESKAIVKIIPSKAKRLIKIWFRWITIVRIEIKGPTENREVMKVIALRRLLQSSDYKTDASKLAFKAQKTGGYPDLQLPKLLFYKLSSE